MIYTFEMDLFSLVSMNAITLHTIDNMFLLDTMVIRLLAMMATTKSILKDMKAIMT